MPIVKSEYKWILCLENKRFKQPGKVSPVFDHKDPTHPSRNKAVLWICENMDGS